MTSPMTEASSDLDEATVARAPTLWTVSPTVAPSVVAEPEPTTAPDLDTDAWVEVAPELLAPRAVVLFSVLAVAAIAGLDLVLTGGRLTFFFDLCFVVVCLIAAGAIRESGLFTVGVLPPFLYAGAIAVLAVAAPHAFESDHGLVQVFLTGIATHGYALVSGYAVTLAVIALRMANRRR